MKDRHDMRPSIKFGLSLVGIFCLLGVPAGAQESAPIETTWVTTSHGSYEYDPFHPGGEEIGAVGR